ncbi:helix-turn-helix domain-containing protein [Candidatus Mycobacterium wuenschmannii]|uniref:Helix-turn-helix domain-containing protein n=1 Tax=Candidatus Mycobacterium wuenschmannii TaxID=3027808 RepID=A0ABY8VTU5_9MYCO|nr:helix-turn-helix domain-containing protein [Candidatus Mycobacterium wuenschmannii]WIM87063.1 helix-turn-helix domain-containing protein [Candidatus Mycobacterium wuenschmannii]
MALPREYVAESCPIARTLEIVGERWTLLVIRDAFYGVRRFSDFRAHLDIPKAVLAERLSLLVDEGVLTKADRGEYALTPKGRRLWPTIWSLASWGNENYVDQPQRRSYRHAICGGAIRPDRVCASCGELPNVADLVLHPPRRPRERAVRTDPVSVGLRAPHRLLEPFDAG